MKTERRHELATNVLADWLGEKIEALRPYSAAVSVTALLAVVVVFAGILLYQKRQASTAAAWSAYFSAIESQSPDDASDKLEAVAVDHPGSPAGLWSRLSLADTHLANGVEDLFKDRSAARKALDQAQQAYQAVLDEAPPDSLLAERATFGLAETYESKNELEPARKHYQALLERWPNGAFSALAKARVDDLERKSTKDFYDWFAKQSTQTKPKPLGGPGEKPAFDFGNLPDESFESGLKVGGKKEDSSAKKPADDKAADDEATPTKGEE
jgi:tetratricopeptide (TPR) repeat protein